MTNNAQGSDGMSCGPTSLRVASRYSIMASDCVRDLPSISRVGTCSEHYRMYLSLALVVIHACKKRRSHMSGEPISPWASATHLSVRCW